MLSCVKWLGDGLIAWLGWRQKVLRQRRSRTIPAGVAAAIRPTRSSSRTSGPNGYRSCTGDAKAHPLAADDERQLLF
jgi:hypothetical protein